MNPGVYITHNLSSSLLEYTDIGVYANLQDAALALNNVKKCTVTTPISCPGLPLPLRHDLRLDD